MKTGKKSGPNRTPLLVAVAVIMVIIVAAAGWWFFLRSTPEQTVEGYLKASKAGNEQAAKAYLTAGSIKAADELEQSMSALGPPGGSFKLASNLVLPMYYVDMDFEVGKATVDGDSATVPITLGLKGKDSTGRQRPIAAPPVHCVREGGKWKVDLSQKFRVLRQMMNSVGGGMGGPMEQMTKQMQETYGKNGSTSSSSPSATKLVSTPSTPPLPSTAGAENSAAEMVARGMAAKKKGDMTAAATAFNRALKLEPKNVDAHWGLAWVLADQGKKSEAIQHFRQVVQLAKDATRKSEAQDAIKRLQ